MEKARLEEERKRRRRAALMESRWERNYPLCFPEQLRIKKHG